MVFGLDIVFEAEGDIVRFYPRQKRYKIKIQAYEGAVQT